VESIDRTQRSESNSNQHNDSDILTISDSSEEEEWGETDASGRDVCPSSSLRCFLNYEMSTRNLSIIADLHGNISNSMEEFQNRKIIQYLSIADSSLPPLCSVKR